MSLKHYAIAFQFTCVSFFPFVVHSQVDSVDAFIERNMKGLRIPGLSIAVIKDGKPIKSGGYGFANLESAVPATAKTVYEIGSMTKQFTALSIMMLIEEGKLALKDTISSFFPGAPSSWNNITIRQLLTHTSGIQNHVAVAGYLRVFRTSILGDAFPPKEEIVKLFFQLPQEFSPGETWAYDNTGYYLLGLIIEKLSKQSYWTFLDQRIFKPLGMKCTRNTDTKPLVLHRAAG
jgi:CubicO group peptidase (beta-lactamase class C family)